MFVRLVVSPPARGLKRVLVLCLALLASLRPGQPATAQDIPTYRVVLVAPGDALNIRSGPSAGYPVVGMIPRQGGACAGWGIARDGAR